MQNILKKIIKQKKEDLEDIKRKHSLDSIDQKIKSISGYLDFRKTLIDCRQKNQVSLIAEIKKASPSAGIIVEDFDHVKIADKEKDFKNSYNLAKQHLKSGKVFDHLKKIRDI